jgi:two-component system, NarL family, nitrate/nitrite response regulator NarL
LVRVLVLSSIRAYSEALAYCLSQNKDLDAVASAPGLALATAQKNKPNIVVFDGAISSDDVVHVGDIVMAMPELEIVALCVSDMEADVIAHARLGATGYVSKDASLSELCNSLLGAARGEVVCPPRIARCLLRELGRIKRGRRNSAVTAVNLTRREQAILCLVDRGLSNKEIAYELRLSVSTVKNHIHVILEKLHVHRRSEAAAFVRQPVA